MCEVWLISLDRITYVCGFIKPWRHVFRIYGGLETYTEHKHILYEHGPPEYGLKTDCPYIDQPKNGTI